MSEKLLGEGSSFEDVEKLRKQLVAHEIRVFDIDEKIRIKTEELQSNKGRDLEELRRGRAELLRDKDRRSEHNITNQRDWELYIKNTLTYEWEIGIIERYTKLEEEIKAHQHRIRLNKIQMKNLEWKLRNRLVFANAILNGFQPHMDVAATAK